MRARMLGVGLGLLTLGMLAPSGASALTLTQMLGLEPVPPPAPGTTQSPTLAQMLGLAPAPNASPGSGSEQQSLAQLLGLAPAPASPGGEAPAQPSLAQMLGLTPKPAPPPPPDTSVDASGALIVDSPLSPLPAPVRGHALWPRAADGHINTGFNDLTAKAGGQTNQQAVEAHQDLGAEIARIPISWAGIEPANGVQDWAGVDARYRPFVEAGIRPLFTFVKTPGWAINNFLRCPYSACTAPPPGRHMDGYARVAGDLARRYPLAAGIEIWNEPNLQSHWDTTLTPAAPSPATYTEMLTKSYDAIKAKNPKMRVLGGALSNFGVWDESGQWPGDKSGIAIRPFLRGMLDRGAGNKMDALSFHPYPYKDRSIYFDRAFSGVQAELDAAGFGDMRLVASEVGVSLNSQGYAFTPAEQAEALRSVTVSLDERAPVTVGSDRTDAIIFHKDFEDGTGYGWLELNQAQQRWVKRPVFCVVTAALDRHPSGC